jgi:hypothetical protein
VKDLACGRLPQWLRHRGRERAQVERRCKLLRHGRRRWGKGSRGFEGRLSEGAGSWLRQRKVVGPAGVQGSEQRRRAQAAARVVAARHRSLRPRSACAALDVYERAGHPFDLSTTDQGDARSARVIIRRRLLVPVTRGASCCEAGQNEQGVRDCEPRATGSEQRESRATGKEKGASACDGRTEAEVLQEVVQKERRRRSRDG